ncbi:MAG: 30S ribosomal protein S20 [Bacteroidia bacterium]|nr:30S ribosomal protein S20 [Bacteroidia bacterium]
MANIKSVIKDIRKNRARREHNRYYAKTARTFVKRIRLAKDKKTALELQPKVFSMLDKLAKKNVIHPNKAANIKSKLSKIINNLK